MAEERPAFLCYAKEWIAATRGLPLAARGAYWDLLCFAWLDGSVTADLDDLRRQVGADKPEWARIWPKLSPRWVESGGRLYNERLEEVRAESYAFTEARRRAGRKGGLAKATAKQTSSKAPSKDVATDVAKTYPASASASSVTDHVSNETRSVSARATGVRADDYLNDPGELPTRRGKAWCAFVSRKGVDVPHDLHDEFLRKMADTDEPALFAWYAATEAAWAGKAVGDDCWRFWRARFAEWQGTTVTRLQPKADTTGWAEGLVAGAR